MGRDIISGLDEAPNSSSEENYMWTVESERGLFLTWRKLELLKSSQPASNGGLCCAVNSEFLKQ